MEYEKHDKALGYQKERFDKIFKKLEGLNLDGLLISNQSNITYLLGCPIRDAYLLLANPDKFITPKNKKLGFFITDFRYFEEAKKNLKNFFIKRADGSLFNLISKLAAQLKLKKVGFEAKNLAFAEYEKIKEGVSPDINLIPTYDLIEPIREIKSDYELDLIREAVRINIQAFKFARNIIKPGLTEWDLANKLEGFIKEKGADSFSFDIIVASGAHSSFPHHLTSREKIKANQPLLIDMGVDFKGYKSDLTRVFFLGKITPVFKRTYEIILRAQEKAIRHIKPRISISNIDRIARQYIAQRGFGRFFGHNLGHGIGLEVHEEPHISAKNNRRLMEGMVFTIEPAIYLPEKFGIRIEDMVLVTKKGVEVLSGNLDKSI